MPFFKTPANALHFLSDEDIANGGESLLPAGCAAITDAEADQIRAARQPAPSAADLIKRQIAELEATATPRRMREAVLGTDGGWLANLDAQIQALRKQLA